MDQEQKQQKKVIMNHNLAKALMEAGVEHFAGGGFMGDIARSITPTSEYQAQLAPQQTTNYAPVQGQSAQNFGAGYGQSQNLMGQQQSLANQLQQQTLGRGPNPAQLALANATGQNVKQQAALMAGQRGASANPALMARQIAQQGAATQQQAAGQSALMQAQQQLAAQGALAGQQQAMQQANLGQQGLQGNMFTGAGQLQNAQNQAAIQNYGMMQALNQKTQQEKAEAERATVGGIFGGLGSILGLGGGGGAAGGGGGSAGGFKGLLPLLAANEGGEVPGMAKGGKIKDFGKPKLRNVDLPSHFGHIAAIYHPEMMAEGGMTDYTDGGHVAGQAQVSGDSVKNDTVPAVLSPGEVVLPRSVTMSPNAPSKAAEFMKAILLKKESQKGYSRVADAKKGKK